MFSFGDPEETARMFLDMYRQGNGPKIPEVHYEELSERSLRELMAYLYLALRRGVEQGLEEEVVAYLRQWYDEVFMALAGASKRFREMVRKGYVFPPEGPKARPKYLKMIEEASES